MAKKTVTVYELDFGDTNLIDTDIKNIISWIECDMQDMGLTTELNYTITKKEMTESAFKKLPEWS